MKIVEQPHRGTELIGVGETVKITVSADGEMIKNMINSIYSKKEKTVVRELMANALDAHAACNKDAPIDVYLPTSYDPTFIVRDYGIGMTHDFVMRLYSVLGFSTKSGDNNQTGMFGVGSKSPLSICDTFTVRCFDKPGWDADHPMNATGRIRLYTISIGNDGIPMISHTFDVLPRDEDKIEEGGTEIRVPVDQMDRVKLIDGLVSQQFCWFDKNVNFGGAYDSIKENLYLGIIKISDRMYMARPSKAQAEKFNYAGDWKVFVRQGAAVYDVSLEQIRYKLKSEYITALKALCTHNRHVLIDLPIGTVDVTMAREGIQYNNTSTDNLVNTMEAAMADFEQTLEEQIGDARTPVDALKRLATYFIADPVERTKFNGLKLAASLLPLVVKLLRKNYDAWYDTADLVEFTRLAKDDKGDFINDAQGNPVWEKYTDKPVYTPPAATPSFRMHDFASGKVHMTEAAVFSHGSACGALYESTMEQIKVHLPNAFYVVPLHLAKWKERISAHVEKTFDADDFPMSARDGMKIYIIRVAKKNIVGVLNKLKDAGVLMAHFTEEDLPAISAGTATITRQTSKNAVTQFGTASWANKTKVDPDYTQPAYYLVRVGQTNECYTSRADNTYTAKTELRTRVGEYQIEKILYYGRLLGIVDKALPVYRLTEKQATRIERTAPSWIPLVDHVAVEAEKAQNSSVLFALESSVLTMSGDYATRSFVTEALRGNKGLFDMLYTLCNSDPMFCAVVGVRDVWNNTHAYPDLKLETETLSHSHDLQNILFGKALGVNDTQIDYLNKIATNYEERYYNFSTFVTGRNEPKAIRNSSYYVHGLVSMLKDEIAQQDFHIRYTEVNNIVDAFKKRLDEVHANLYPAPTVTLEELGATGND